MPDELSAAEQIAATETELRRRFRVVETRVDVGDRALTMLHPASADELIDDDAFARDERLPYWAELWPSAMALVTWLHGPRAGPPSRVLELGCGCGLVSAGAARLGHEVVAIDYEPDALAFARVNAWRNAGVAIATRVVDWRDPPPDLGQYHLVLASDVLYERAYAEPVAACLAATLAPGGRAVIADPGRAARGAFLDACRSHGLGIDQLGEIGQRVGIVTQRIALIGVARASSHGRAR